MSDDQLDAAESDRVTLAREAAEVRTAVTVLAQRVDSLAGNVARVNELAESQQKVDRQSAMAVFEAAQALEVARQTRKNAVSKSEHEKAVEDARDEAIISIKKLKSRMLKIGATFLVATIAVAAIAIAVVAQQVRHTRNDRVAECEKRVASSKLAIQAYDKLLDSTTAQHDATFKGLIETSLAASKRGAAIDCKREPN